MVTHLQCFLWGSSREWHTVTAQFVVINMTATTATTVVSDFALSGHRGSEAVGCGQAEEALCHTCGAQLYLSVQVTLEGQAPVTRLLGRPPSPECNGPSLGWLIPVTSCIGFCALSHGRFQFNPEILFKKQKLWRMAQWLTSLGIWKWNNCGMILLLPKLIVKNAGDDTDSVQSWHVKVKRPERENEIGAEQPERLGLTGSFFV